MTEYRGDEIIIGCRTLVDELAAVVEKTGVRRPVIWLEHELHDTPDELKSTLQGLLDGLDYVNRVIFLYGNCGNGVQGIRTGEFELIVPRLDDCISLLIGSQERRTELSSEYAAMFYTEGWLRGKRNLTNEYKITAEKFGMEMAIKLHKMMLANYRSLALLDTGLCPIEKLEEETQEACELFELDQVILPATLTYLEELVCGPWPEERFVHVPPRSEVKSSDFLLPSNSERQTA